MKCRVVLLAACIALSLVARASSQDDAPKVVFPAISSQPQTKAGLVPKGWVVESESSGDLNSDGVPDLTLVLRMKDPKNVLKNSGWGENELDTNPRMLVIAFADRSTKMYSSVLANHTLIPRHTNYFMEDPFQIAEIVKGTVQVSVSSFMTAGSWYTSQSKFTFRYQDGCFKLIGYDGSELKRNTGEMLDTSVNYLTRKVKITKGDAASDETKVAWKTLRKPSLLCLDAVGDGLDFSPES
jgi:hypothetical protein